MSGSHNKGTAQAAYEAFGSGDLEGALRNVSDDIEWVVPGDSAISGTYRGKDEVTRLFVQLAGGGFSTKPQRFIAEDDHVVVLTHVTVEGETHDEVNVLMFRDGQLVSFRSFGDAALLDLLGRVWSGT